MEIGRIGVVGAGTMGHGIAQVSAMAGFEVVLLDVKQEFLDNALRKVSSSLDRLIEKGKINPAEKGNTLGRIKTTLSYRDLAYCDLVIEAVVEKMEIKRKVFKELDSMCKPGTILASNTSSISINEIANAVKRSENAVGMHFFNPVPIMKLVEVVKGKKTSDETVFAVRNLAEKMGKTPVIVNDSPGFVSNRVLMPMINEAALALHEGVADKEGIDAIMKLGANHPMGPLELADLVGIDVCVDILNVLRRSFKDDKYRPCPLLVKMAKEGKLGRKTGEGFYKY